MESAILKMPDHARIWIYQSDRAMNAQEKDFITRELNLFVGQWAAHGQQLLADYSIEMDRFIVLAVDESLSQASGCSIDASVHVVRRIEQKTGLSLLDRTKIAFLRDNELKTVAFNTIRQQIAEGNIHRKTLIFNNAVQNAGEWRAKWKVAADESWLSKYFS